MKKSGSQIGVCETNNVEGIDAVGLSGTRCDPRCREQKAEVPSGSDDSSSFTQKEPLEGWGRRKQKTEVPLEPEDSSSFTTKHQSSPARKHQRVGEFRGPSGSEHTNVPFLTNLIPGHMAAKEVSDGVLSFVPEAKWIDARTLRYFTILPKPYVDMTIEELGCLQYRKAVVETICIRSDRFHYTDFKGFGRINGELFLARKTNVKVVEYVVELAVLRSCQHRNIVALLDVPKPPPGELLSIEWPGDTLQTICERNHVLYLAAPRLVKNYMFQLLQGVSFLHSRGVVSRNLKPGNIFVNSDGIVKISDFLNASVQPLKPAKARRGTLTYMPPEVLLGGTQSSFSYDVWSIGAIFSYIARGSALSSVQRTLFLAPGCSTSQIGVLHMIFRVLGTPSEVTWPGVTRLPHYSILFPSLPRSINETWYPSLGKEGFLLLNRLLTYAPGERISCDDALLHPYFHDVELAVKAPYPRQKESTTTARGKWVDIDDVQSYELKTISKVHGFFRASEEWMDRPKTKYINIYQEDINPRVRAILVDWLVEVMDEYSLRLETLFAAVNYFDRCLGIVQVTRHKIQALGCACMLVASKLIEKKHPPVKEFVYISDNLYTEDQISRMESQVLEALQFDLICVTPISFLPRYVNAANADFFDHSICSHLQQLSSYLCVLGLQEHSLIRFRPSKIAAASIALARRTLGMSPVWHSTLEYYSSYTIDDLATCEWALHACHCKSLTFTLQAARTLYRTDAHDKVSNIAPLSAEALEQSIERGRGDSIPPWDSWASVEEVRRVTGLEQFDVGYVIKTFALAAKKDGALDRNAFVGCFKSLLDQIGGYENEEEDSARWDVVMTRLFDLFDNDGNGAVDFSELVCGLTVLSGGSGDDKTRAAFSQFDHNGEGVITLEEMQRYLCSVFKVMYETQPGKRDEMGISAEELAAVTAEQAFEDADLNHEGRLSLEEFQKWATSGDGSRQAACSTVTAQQVFEGADLNQKGPNQDGGHPESTMATSRAQPRSSRLQPRSHRPIKGRRYVCVGRKKRQNQLSHTEPPAPRSNSLAGAASP